MALTLISTTASERLLRHVQSLSEAEAEDALHLLVQRRERVRSKDADHTDPKLFAEPLTYAATAQWRAW